MSENLISKALKDFVFHSIDSAEQLDILRLLHSDVRKTLASFNRKNCWSIFHCNHGKSKIERFGIQLDLFAPTLSIHRDSYRGGG